LGITIPSGATWTPLLISSPSTPTGGSGLFTARQLRDSQDLYDAIQNGDLEWSKDGISVELNTSYVADVAYMSDLSDDLTGLGGSDYFIDSGTTVHLDELFTGLEVPRVELNDPDIYVTSSGDNLVFKDKLSTTTTLTELKSMRNIWITASGLASGNITLSDSANWNTRYSQIGTIYIKTTSSKYDLWIFEDSSFDINSLRSRQLISAGKGDMVITADIEVNSSDTNLYLRWTHTAGGAPPSASFYITGEARRH
jgi:hypothetical protein